jgi:hypothetical protein
VGVVLRVLDVQKAKEGWVVLRVLGVQMEAVPVAESSQTAKEE